MEFTEGQTLYAIEENGILEEVIIEEVSDTHVGIKDREGRYTAMGIEEARQSLRESPISILQTFIITTKGKISYIEQELEFQREALQIATDKVKALLLQ